MKKIGLIDMRNNYSNIHVSLKEINIESSNLKRECNRTDNSYYCTFDEIEDINLIAGILTINDSYILFDEQESVANMFKK